MPLVYGYGSLTDLATGHPARTCHARGLRRTWDVAMDNGRDLPGYKHYVTPQGERPPTWFVTFLNLREVTPEEAAVGVLLEVTEAELAELDTRERNYRRVDITSRIAEPVSDVVWAYLGTPDARERFQRGHAAGTAIVARGYLDAVRSGFAALGGEVLEEWAASTDPPPCPIVDALRVDH